MSNPDEMEMPCLCDCGEWFDLTDGVPTKVWGKNKVICTDCAAGEQQREEIEAEIEELEEQGNKKREIKKLQKQLMELGGSLNG